MSKDIYKQHLENAIDSVEQFFRDYKGGKYSSHEKEQVRRLGVAYGRCAALAAEQWIVGNKDQCTDIGSQFSQDMERVEPRLRRVKKELFEAVDWSPYINFPVDPKNMIISNLARQAYRALDSFNYINKKHTDAFRALNRECDRPQHLTDSQLQSLRDRLSNLNRHRSRDSSSISRSSKFGELLLLTANAFAAQVTKWNEANRREVYDENRYYDWSSEYHKLHSQFLEASAGDMLHNTALWAHDTPHRIPHSNRGSDGKVTEFGDYENQYSEYDLERALDGLGCLFDLEDICAGAGINNEKQTELVEILGDQVAYMARKWVDKNKDTDLGRWQEVERYLEGYISKLRERGYDPQKNKFMQVLLDFERHEDFFDPKKK